MSPMLLAAGLALALGVQEGSVIRAAEGWVVERAAGAPLVERPVLGAFDDRGRLYVIDSAGVNLKGSELAKDPPHRIRRLEDRDGDGRFDASTVFADRLVFPQGILWHDGAIFVVSPPGFWKLEDLDGDGVCDRRTELLTGFANTGVADDAHGACLGPDGRIYFLPGRMNHDLRFPDGRPLRRATGPWLMRMRPDGRDIEFVSGAQGNPVEVDWLPEGDFFVSGTFWAPDAFGGGLRDAIIHGVEGGEYAVRDRTYRDRKRTGDFLPALVPMIATAPSGMLVVRSDGPGQGDLLCTYFNTHKVQRHRLEREGAGFVAGTEEWVSSEHPDFHPTDVIEDADGSFLVLDTGGWFRIGCPTSQVAKPQVLGGIYRLRRKGAPFLKDPRGLLEDWSEPGRLLDDPRWAVRERAVHLAAKGDPEGIEAAFRSPSPRSRLNAVWAATRVDGDAARALVRRALDDADPRVRQAAATSAGLHRDAAATVVLERRVAADLPPVRREAAGALGRIGGGSGALLEAARTSAEDRVLEHAIIFALLRIGDGPTLARALEDGSASVRRAALIALDQMDDSPLRAQQVTPLLGPSDPRLQQAAFRVLASRPAWSGEILSLSRQWLQQAGLDETRAEILRGVLASFAGDYAFQDLSAGLLRDPGTPSEGRRLLLEGMARAPLDRMPAIWLAEARWALEDADEAVRRRAIAVIKASGGGEFDPPLLRLAREERQGVDLRLEALGAAAPRMERLDAPLFAFLGKALDKEQPPLRRLLSADVLGRSRLDEEQLRRLLTELREAGPLELPRLLPAFERSGKEPLLKALLDVLEASPALPSLRAESILRIFEKHPGLSTRVAGLLKRLDVDVEAMKRRLEELRPVLGGGDPKRGREVFLGQRAGCIACHRVQDQGAKVGPDLSRIGAIRSAADLLEAIVFPSASFARGFESILIRTRDGAVVDGILLRETPEAVVLFLADRTERRVPKASIEELREGRVSVMPQGLDLQIGTEDLRHLIAYLTSLK